MDFLELCFWFCVAVVVYTYAGYPLLLAVWAKFRKRPVLREPGRKFSVSLIVCAHNEERTIARRLEELTGLLNRSGVAGEVLVVSDGSHDQTAALARSFPGSRVRVCELAERKGKAAALSHAAALASHDVIVLADTRQRWDEGALSLLLENFADPAIGAVSGDLVVECAPGVLAGVSMYWRYEKWLRKKESQLHSMVGVTGAICAVRRTLFRPIPPGLILDDVYWPLRVAMQGFRVIHDKRALAFDRLPELARDEFRRKVRTLSGNFQLLAKLPQAPLPWRNPIWFQFISHKLLRLLVPWAVLGMVVTSYLIGTPFFKLIFLGQLVGGLVAAAGMLRMPGSRHPLVSAASSLVVLNAAAWVAFWVWLSGRSGRSWHKVAYAAGPTPRADAGNATASTSTSGSRNELP